MVLDKTPCTAKSTGLCHYKLDLPDSIVNKQCAEITIQMLNIALRWLLKNMWFANPPITHGDLTDSNNSK